MYTLLDLVNACLRALANEQASNLDFPDVDTDIAMSTVDAAVVDVLSKGYWFNTEEHWKLAPDLEGHIAIPLGILGTRTARCSKDIKLTVRGGKAYDMTNHTFDMTNNVQNDGYIDFDFLMNLAIEDCPVQAQQYMRELAVGKFLTDLEYDAIKIQKSEQRAVMYLALLEKEHYRNSRYNLYQHSGVQAVLGGMHSVNSFAGYSGNIAGNGPNQ